MGLIEAVEDLFDNLNDMEDMEATIVINGELKERLPENKEIMLYRVIQELVNNSLKHSGADKISLNMKIFPNQLYIKYNDNGKGFDVKKTMQSQTGSFGLKNLESRVDFLSGEMEIQSSPGQGVSCTIQLSI
jgi:signal transduction histidine kinase